jgi:hypothetical protein
MKLVLNIQCAFVDMLHSATAGYLPNSALELHHAETTVCASHLEAHFQAALHLHVMQFITTGRRCYIIFSPRDSVCRLQGNLTATCWKDKREVYFLSNRHIPPADGSFEEGGKAVMPPVIQDYTVSVCSYVDLSDRMTNSYSMSKITWNMTKNSSFIC